MTESYIYAWISLAVLSFFAMALPCQSGGDKYRVRLGCVYPLLLIVFLLTEIIWLSNVQDKNLNQVRSARFEPLKPFAKCSDADFEKAIELLNVPFKFSHDTQLAVVSIVICAISIVIILIYMIFLHQAMKMRILQAAKENASVAPSADKKTDQKKEVLEKRRKEGHETVQKLRDQLGPFDYTMYEMPPSSLVREDKPAQKVDNDAEYEGQWANGMKDGRGQQIEIDGSIYEGYWS